jgi:hypothetical protein
MNTLFVIWGICAVILTALVWYGHLRASLAKSQRRIPTVLEIATFEFWDCLRIFGVMFDRARPHGLTMLTHAKSLLASGKQLFVDKIRRGGKGESSLATSFFLKQIVADKEGRRGGGVDGVL